MMNRRWYALALLLACAATGVWAAEDEVELNRVMLSTRALRQVPNDLVGAVMAVTVEDRDPARLADAINRAMTWALDIAKQADRVTVQTGSYSTHPVYSDHALTHWRGRQELHLEGRDVGVLTRLIAKLQGQLQLEHMNFSISPERRQEVENTLITEALNAFKERAGIVRTNLGFHGYDIVHLNIDTGGNGYHPVQSRMRAMAAEVSAPAVEPGTSQLSVLVSGTVQLK